MSNLECIIDPIKKNLGGFTVGRILPFAKKRSVGPFVFLDHMGPAEFEPGQGMQVRPHPHIGLSTLTYLFEGCITHRDSLGSVQDINPGDVNWMTAGKGIVHSERTPEILKNTKTSANGLQFWIGLPKVHEEVAPTFNHYPALVLPQLEGDGAKIKLIAGNAFLRRSPVNTFSPLFFFEVYLQAGKKFLFQPTRDQEAALYLLHGEILIEGNIFNSLKMPVWKLGKPIEVFAQIDTHFVVLGGEPFEEPRTIWWNFVSTSKDRIEQAKSDWKESRFKQVPGETEFIPLPIE